MEKLLIDSSVYLSALLDGEVHQSDSRDLFQKLLQHNIQLIMPISILMELCMVAQRHQTNAVRNEILRFIEERAFELVILDETFFYESFLPHYSKFHLKTADAIIAATAISQHAVLITWDKALLRAHIKPSVALTPTDYLTQL